MASGLSTLRLPLWDRIDVRLKTSSAMYALKTFLAVALALFVGFAADLPRPYWAVLTIYLTVQPLAGALRSRAVYRVLGTILGGVAAVALVPNFVNSPALLSVLMAVWIGFCLFLSLLDRTPRAYIFLLGGFTTGIIGFQSVNAPENIFDTAVARVEEICVGILAATLVHSIIFPRQVTVALNQRIDAFLHDSRDWISRSLRGVYGGREDQELRKLAADVTELQILATHLPFDTSSHRPRIPAVHALQDRLAMQLPLITGIEDRINALNEMGRLPPWLDALRQDVAAFIAQPTATWAEADALSARCIAAAPAIDFSQPIAIWSSLLAISATVRLSDLIEDWRDSLAIAAYVRDPLRPAPDIDPLVRARARRPLHNDAGLALQSAASLVLTVLLVCAFWIATAWPSGGIAAMLAAVISSFFATQDDPAPAIMSFLQLAIIAVPIAMFYDFAVLPAIDGYVMLMVAFAPLYLVIGYMQADPILYQRAMPIIIVTTLLLSLQENYSPDFTQFINTALAILVGIITTLWVTRIVRATGASWSAWRIYKQGWRDLADLAAGRRSDDTYDWTNLMLDRVGLIAPRLALVQNPEEFFAVDALADLRTGNNIITLRDAAGEHRLPELRRVFALISEAYGRRTAKQKDVFGPQLLQALDNTIVALGRLPPEEYNVRLAAALAGLRRTLYPQEKGFAA